MNNRSEELLATGEVYHIYSKSIAGFVIFNNESEFSRIINLIKYYKLEKPPTKFSYFINHTEGGNLICDNGDNLIDIIAYCIMPTHIHLILKQTKDNGISIFMRKVLDSYTRYFNTKHDRKGPLWESRFKRVFVKTDEQLLHLTRYLHLNPVTAYLVDKPEKWHASSYKEYLFEVVKGDEICNYSGILEIDPLDYKKFVEDRISYQRELAKIKDLILE